MTSRLDEVDASVYTIVHDVHAVDFVLSIQISVKALLDVVHNRSPRAVVVYKVAKAGSVHNCQSQTNAVLLNVGTDGLYSDGLGDDVKARLLGLTRRIQGGVE